MITHATANLWEAGEYREIQDKTKICDKKMQVLRLLPPSALILKDKAFKHRVRQQKSDLLEKLFEELS